MMRITERVWMLGAISGGQPVLFHRLVATTRRRLIAEARAIYQGAPWSFVRHQGWRAVRVTITGQIR